MEYHELLQSKRLKDTPTGHEPQSLNENLFDFQGDIVKWAVRRGRAAIFADTGLGKTLMQCAWADEVAIHTNGAVLIIAPLAVTEQTIRDANKFGIAIDRLNGGAPVLGPHIYVINYEQLHNVDLDQFHGVVLDESSILKAHDGKTRTAIIERCQTIRYRLACTATPSPNDFEELGNHAEFLGIMSRLEMLAMFFTHDGGETSKWRLKGWGASKFFEWMSSWAVVIRDPDDLGYDGSRYKLPPLNYEEHMVKVESTEIADLFIRPAQSLTEQRQAQRESMGERVNACADLVNATEGPWIVWCHLNAESEALAAAIDGAVQIQGSDDPEVKKQRMLDFSDGNIRVLVTKPKIAGFGMNWQHCNQMAFVGVSNSFEAFYQAVRRCYRFGQQESVSVHLFTAETEGHVLANLQRKEEQHHQMHGEMVHYMRDLMKKQIKGATMEKMEYETDTHEGAGYTLHLGDCVEVAGSMDADSVDYSVFSPPFASLYTYSNSERDMGNCKDDAQFFEQFQFLADELLRITKPGRNCSAHCMNLPSIKAMHGFIGIRDFRGEIIRAFEKAGWIFHSEVVIWKDPVTAMQRTKALGLLHKQIKKNSAMSRQGIPDYVVTFRKPGECTNPVTHADDLPVELWQKYASPVWMDINPSRTLQHRQARDENDERHICPLQLDVIERCIHLWSNPRDVVFSPFMGIGSEGYTAIKMGRRFVGAELKRSYYEMAKRNIADALVEQNDLFSATA